MNPKENYIRLYMPYGLEQMKDKWVLFNRYHTEIGSNNEYENAKNIQVKLKIPKETIDLKQFFLSTIAESCDIKNGTGELILYLYSEKTYPWSKKRIHFENYMRRFEALFNLIA